MGFKGTVSREKSQDVNMGLLQAGNVKTKFVA